MEKKLIPLLLAPLLFMSACATHKTAGVNVGIKQGVRTTAYTHTEAGGCHNAVGCQLNCGKLNSAAADWSRFPLGTMFKIIATGEIFQVDDYGSALVGTNTIDLYKNSRLAMRDWGVRNVEIQILAWGSPQKSLQVLAPRAKNSHVRRMIASLRNKKS